nr:diguanylate cyclase [Lachnospiraceae bacterium]
AFDEAITEILESDAEAEGETVVIALVDLDEFMRVNTDFGRDEGDRVLIDTGRYIASKAGKNAKVFRIGGDEFGIIFRGTEEREDVFLLLEDLRRNFNVTLPDKTVMTMTIGMATAFEDANRCAELIRKADSALYRAKISGRNKVAMAKEEKMIPKTAHFTQDQLKRLNKLSKREDIGEAILLREALDMLLKKYDI